MGQWGMVRAQENIQIFPDSIHADYFLNTSLIYEMAVLANYCRTILAEVLLDFLVPVAGCVCGGGGGRVQRECSLSL